MAALRDEQGKGATKEGDLTKRTGICARHLTDGCCLLARSLGGYNFIIETFSTGYAKEFTKLELVASAAAVAVDAVAVPAPRLF